MKVLFEERRDHGHGVFELSTERCMLGNSSPFGSKCNQFVMFGEFGILLMLFEYWLIFGERISCRAVYTVYEIAV